jgi:hypothetical protein
MNINKKEKVKTLNGVIEDVNNNLLTLLSMVNRLNKELVERGVYSRTGEINNISGDIIKMFNLLGKIQENPIIN